MQIYKTTNLINKKSYIGKEKGDNPEYLGSGKILGYAIKKYGRENFKKEIIKKCWSIEEHNESEKYWIKALNTFVPNGYNIAKGGSGGNTYSYRTEEEKKLCGEKISKSKNSEKCKNAYKNIERNKKISLSKLNKKQSQEHIKNKKLAFARPDVKEKQSVSAKNREKVKCFYCHVEMNISFIYRWHNNNCKMSPQYNKNKNKWSQNSIKKREQTKELNKSLKFGKKIYYKINCETCLKEIQYIKREFLKPKLPIPKFCSCICAAVGKRKKKEILRLGEQ